MNILTWLARQLEAPGALAGFLQFAAILLALWLVVQFRRGERRRVRQKARREAAALAEIADHACDLVVEVADSLRDEINAAHFVEQFDRRALIDADLMLEAIAPDRLPSLTLLRPLFELRWAVERALEVSDWLAEAMEDPERQGWRENAADMRALAERAVIAADSFRAEARRAGR